MKKTILIFCLLLKAAITLSQVKISAAPGTPPMSSILDVESSNRGFLPPRIWLTSNTMPLNGGIPLDGVIVFNTNFGDSLGGLCIWHHSRWNKLMDSGINVNDGAKTDFIELRQTANQNLSLGNNILNWHAITNAQYDDGYVPTLNNPGNILIRKTGVYSVTARVNTATFNSVPVNSRYLFISVNGVQVAAAGFNHSASNPLLTVSTMIYCNQNDIINIGVFTTLSNAFTNIVDKYSVNCFVSQIPPNTFE